VVFSYNVLLIVANDWQVQIDLELYARSNTFMVLGSTHISVSELVKQIIIIVMWCEKNVVSVCM